MIDDLWEVDFTPQTYKEEPGKWNRPSLTLILQVNLLNGAGYLTSIVAPGTTNIYRDDQRARGWIASARFHWENW